MHCVHSDANCLMFVVCQPEKQHLLQLVMLLCFHIVDQQHQHSVIHLYLTLMLMPDSLQASLQAQR